MRILIHLSLLLACGVAPLRAQAPRVEKAPGPAAATNLTPADVARLRWIEGTWRGVGAEGTVQDAFFERYAFRDSVTLVVHHFRDSTLTAIADSSIYILDRGRFATTGTGPRWAAARIGDDMAVFIPIARARNAFAWRRGATADAWTAQLEFADAAGQPHRRAYAMTRVR